MNVNLYHVDQSTGDESHHGVYDTRDLELYPQDINVLNAGNEVMIGGGAGPLFVVRKAAV